MIYRGKMGLVVYSNGNVGICERLPDNILNIGNIKYNTLFDLRIVKIILNDITKSRFV